MATKPYYCVVHWNKLADAPDSYYGCSTIKAKAQGLADQMTERGRLRIRVVKRASRPRGAKGIRR